MFDAHGGFWFTDHGVRQERTSDRTGLHYAKPDGSSCEEVVFPLDAPNGIGLSPDGTVLYAAETHTGRVYSWPVTAPGQVGVDHADRATVATCWPACPGCRCSTAWPSTASGWVCVGTLVNGGITADLARRRDRRTTRPLPDPLVTNICFGGAGPAHRVRDPVGHRPAGRAGLAPPGPAAPVHRLTGSQAGSGCVAPHRYPGAS